MKTEYADLPLLFGISMAINSLAISNINPLLCTLWN